MSGNQVFVANVDLGVSERCYCGLKYIYGFLTAYCEMSEKPPCIPLTPQYVKLEDGQLDSMKCGGLNIM